MSPESQIRLGIYWHLGAVIICEAFSLADRGLLVSHAISSAMYFILGFFLIPAMLSWIACPLVVFIGAVRMRCRWKQCMMALFCEVLLFIMQFNAIAPACM